MTSSDVKHDDEIEIVNKDHYLATLESGAKLNIEMVVEKGKGYVPGERNKKPNQPLGTIPIDSLFSPVRKVNVITEEVRVGQEINYDRLILDVWTNKAIDPQEAVAASGEILSKHINMFFHIGERSDSLTIPVEGLVEGDSEMLETSIEVVDLSSRSLNCLKKAGIKTLGDLVKMTEEELVGVKSLGAKSHDEIKDVLKKFNLSLKGEEQDTEEGSEEDEA